jgi:dipeptidase D
MSDQVRTLEPKPLWNHFADLNAVPRPSKKEDRIRAFMVDFGKSLNLPTRVDEIGNVIITKPASKGMENRAPIVMQSHLDMVHQKNASTDFDFENEGIRMLVDGDWVKAEGTTLGADNGIGVATIMAILASDEIEHPPLEALFTIDEETGMTGAQGLKGGELSGKYLLNLDTEDDDELSIGCAGGIDISVAKTYAPIPTEENLKGLRITVKGLNGGHSGMDIHKGLGNANKLLNRILSAAAEVAEFKLGTFDGGGLRNAIPREAFAVIAISDDQIDALKERIAEVTAELKSEYQTTDPGLSVDLEEVSKPRNAVPNDLQKRLIAAIYACPNGIYRMSPDIPDLVQTSNNLARILVDDGQIEILCLTRSSVDSEKMDLTHAIKANFHGLDAKVEFSGSYPGWTPLPGSKIVSLMSDLYREMFNEEPKVAACHAGLECGILGSNYPEMEMISFGPNIRGAHSPDEKVQVSSVQKFWNYTLETLKRIPSAN